jgi:hypothetical protein
VSEENLELVRGLYFEGGVDMVRLFEDKDRARRAWAPVLHSDFDSISDPQAPGLGGRQAAQTTVKGIDAFVTAWQDFISAFENLWVIPEEFIALPDGRVFVPSEFRAKSKTGNVQMAFDGGIIWTIEDRLVRRLEARFDRRRAFEAAGLQE